MGERGAKRFWHGYYAGKAVDHFTGGVIPSVENASTQEYYLFPPLYDRVREMVGEAPETAIGDKGLLRWRVLQHATNGTAPVFPWLTCWAAISNVTIRRPMTGMASCAANIVEGRWSKSASRQKAANRVFGSAA